MEAKLSLRIAKRISFFCHGMKHGEDLFIPVKQPFVYLLVNIIAG
jgi:hypothetical protein